MADRIKKEVTVKGIYSYTRPAYGYGTERVYIYKMESEGIIYVWKTTTFWCVKTIKTNRKGMEYTDYDKVEKGDVLIITASIKGEDEYNGEKQTLVQRVKLVERTFRAERWEEIQARLEEEKEVKKQAQLESIGDNDVVWNMPYRQYKEHYADCETIIDSYECDRRGHKTIKVIIREGRLKASGVRGEHFSGYELENELGGRTVYRAVSEENAIKRANKDFPDHIWECVKIYR